MKSADKKIEVCLILLLILSLMLSGCGHIDSQEYTRPSYPLVENEFSAGGKYVAVPIRCKTMEEYEAFLQDTYLHETFVHYDDLSSFGEFVEYWANVSPDAEHVHEIQNYLLREPNGNLVYIRFWHMFDMSAAYERKRNWRENQDGKNGHYPMPEVENFLQAPQKVDVGIGNCWYGDLMYMYTVKERDNDGRIVESGLDEVGWLITPQTAVYISPYPLSSKGDAWENKDIDWTDESSLLVQFLDPEKAEDAAKRVTDAVSRAYWRRWFQRRWHLVLLLLCAIVLCTVVLIKRIQHIKHIRQLAAGQSTSQEDEKPGDGVTSR